MAYGYNTGGWKMEEKEGTRMEMERGRGGGIEGSSANRCFQVGKVSRKARCGKIGRRRRPISTARGNM
jgi:hypothetical protein